MLVESMCIHEVWQHLFYTWTYFFVYLLRMHVGVVVTWNKINDFIPPPVCMCRVCTPESSSLCFNARYQHATEAVFLAYLLHHLLVIESLDCNNNCLSAPIKFNNSFTATILMFCSSFVFLFLNHAHYLHIHVQWRI